MERRVEWRFVVESKEDLTCQALDSLFRSIGYFKKIGQEFLIAKAELYIGKLINAYLVTQLEIGNGYKWNPLKRNVREYFKSISKDDSLEDIQPERMLLNACKTWKNIYSLRELLSANVTLVEYYCLTGYHLGASHLFHECWLLISEFFLTDLNTPTARLFETIQSIDYMIGILSHMAWILVTFFSAEEIPHYLLLLDSLQSFKSTYCQTHNFSWNCQRDDQSNLCNTQHWTPKPCEMALDQAEKEAIEQYCVMDNASM